jgi:hypothetical protein
MSDFYKDIIIGLLFVIGIMGFVSGEFILSSTLFATAAIASNVNVNLKKARVAHVSCEQ